MRTLIELPPPSWRGHYSAGDMLVYAADAVAAERERWNDAVMWELDGNGQAEAILIAAMKPPALPITTQVLS